jgi:hypothetical protein
MTTQATSVAAQNTAPAATAAPANLPDLNAGTYNFETVQKILNRTAWINPFLTSGDGGSSRPPRAGKFSGGVVEGGLHRFRVEVKGPHGESGIRATNTLGQRAGSFRVNWSVIPDSFVAQPGRPPVQIPLNPEISQRFVLQEAAFTFGRGEDAFSSFGTGRTFPIIQNGEWRLRALAVGTMMNGVGKFNGLTGTFVFAGNVTENGNFAGSMVLRVADPEERLRAKGPIAPFVPASGGDSRLLVPETTYMMFRAQKRQDQKVTFNIGPSGIRGINVPVDIRRIKVDFSAEGSAGLQNEAEFGPSIASVSSINGVNPLVQGPPPTPISPASSQGVATYTFRDNDGIDAGKFDSSFLESRTFALPLAAAPGLPASRFVFFGPLLSSDGIFSGAKGMLLGTGAASIMPYVLSGMQMLCLEDPDGKFSAG